MRAEDTAGSAPHEEPETHQPPLATVNGRPITRRRVVELLVRSRGADVLEQIIGLELAAMAAAEKGLAITPADVEREYEHTLRRVGDPLSSVTPKSFDRDTAEQLLESVLMQRHLSREEFDILLRRNAYLRRIIESGQSFSEQQLRQEFDRLYGRRVQVRHIQLATLAEVERVKQRLAGGEDFGDVATRYSANMASARVGGLLDPFSADDEDVPPVMRQVAFSLQPGQVSSAVRIGRWYHLIRVEKILPPERRDFHKLRQKIEDSLRKRVSDAVMFDLLEKLFRDATIEIHDPALKGAFDRRHTGVAR